ncbi:MAG: hypothetical protein OK436_00660 [Thaumarchaeota archaeon]|nr:hypothetical protein [Nitrososphaerota archaeon]
MQTTHGKWMPRFLWAATIQGFFAVAWTLFIVNPWYQWFGSVAPSRMIAEGSAGSWFTFGYLLYITIGVIAVAVTGLFYYFIEDVQGKVYGGLTNGLAWLHFVLMNVGVAASTWALMYAGYEGGSYLAIHGVTNGTAIGYAHVNILSPWVTPIGYLVGIAALGAIFGGLGYLIRSRKK